MRIRVERALDGRDRDHRARDAGQAVPALPFLPCRVAPPMEHPITFGWSVRNANDLFDVIVNRLVDLATCVNRERLAKVLALDHMARAVLDELDAARHQPSPWLGQGYCPHGLTSVRAPCDRRAIAATIARVSIGAPAIT